MFSSTSVLMSRPTASGLESTSRAASQIALHVPRGIAHGYQTLEDASMMTYLISVPYVAESARSLRWDDPTVGIEWPLGVAVISERDRGAPSWPPN